MLTNLKLDHGGMAQMLKSGEVAAVIASLAAEVATAAGAEESVQRNAVPVETRSYTTDRAASAVSLAHPAGLPIEGKYGPLTRAAGGAGLEVRGRA